MSSVSVQFLIYVLPTPKCSLLPLFDPITDCLEAQINVSMTFDLYVQNLCDPDISYITDIVLSTPIIGMQISNITSSYAYITFTWIPLTNQIGSQQLCTIAFTWFISFYFLFKKILNLIFK
jgi:hypothetical protein